MVKRAQAAGIIDIHLHQLREYAHDERGTVDDTPYGGGAGMVMKVEPIAEALDALRSDAAAPAATTRVILLSAKGERFTQSAARRLAGFERLIFVCGRYEGVDERVAEHLVDEELSIGDFVLTGGELGAMVVVDAVIRLLPGVLGNADSPLDESFTDGHSLEYPQYTKPEKYRGWRVPEILVSGHHGAIAAWRAERRITPNHENSQAP